MSLIELKDLSVAYGSSEVLSDVSLTVNQGEILTIVGPNGSGKTTLFRALIGSVNPSSGWIIRDKDLKIGYVPQRLHIGTTLPITVERFLRIQKNSAQISCQQALEKAGIQELAQKQVSDLSGGQFQRVMLASALLAEPNLLLLDEATQGLDQLGSADFYRQIEKVRTETNCAVIMISHELHVVMSTSDRVICLNGHICCEGTPEIVTSDPEYHALFGTGTDGQLALYRHHHNHVHDENCSHDHSEVAEQK
ncbi:MAG: ATP-binding cassette domain-containing protein [Paracoccaceae bacterium]